jgi:hypothetical protein
MFGTKKLALGETIVSLLTLFLEEDSRTFSQSAVPLIYGLLKFHPKGNK